MKDESLFFKLFKEACDKCFGHELTEPLSETDSKHLSIKIQEQTGLVIGVKSIRNYSLYIFSTNDEKKENPSVATLDTFARYVLNAPWTDEVQRKTNESHHPYWFQYKKAASQDVPVKNTGTSKNRKAIIVVCIVILMTVIVAAIYKVLTVHDQPKIFTDTFNSVLSDSLKINGWHVKSLDKDWWKKRGDFKGHLSLYTLRGDNWQNGSDTNGIKNLLFREINSDCFDAEIHLTDFFPVKNWQQAGMLLSEDSTFEGKALRISISYNDFFGGYAKAPEILIQGVVSSESDNKSKPEEFSHFPIFTIQPGHEHIIGNNLSRATLKIEKRHNHYRFLYATGSMESFAFKEVLSGNFNIQPKYIGLFAIQGLSPEEECIAAKFDSFTVINMSCN